MIFNVIQFWWLCHGFNLVQKWWRAVWSFGVITWMVNRPLHCPRSLKSLMASWQYSEKLKATRPNKVSVWKRTYKQGQIEIWFIPQLSLKYFVCLHPIKTIFPCLAALPCCNWKHWTLIYKVMKAGAIRRYWKVKRVYWGGLANCWKYQLYRFPFVPYPNSKK